MPICGNPDGPYPVSNKTGLLSLMRLNFLFCFNLSIKTLASKKGQDFKLFEIFSSIKFIG